MPSGTQQPGRREAAVGQVFSVMQKLFPELLDISQEELMELIKVKDPLEQLNEE